MVKLKIKSWEECPIGIYRRLVDVSTDPALSDNERTVAKTAILCDCSEEEIWELPIGTAQDLFRQTMWTSSFDFDKDLKFNKIKVGKYTCKVETDMTKFIVAQYMDFMNYWNSENRGKELENILTVFLVPEGHKYGTGYDIADLKEEITWNVSISIAQSICFFFLKELVRSIKASLTYLDYQLQRMEKKGTEEMMEKIRKERERLTELLSSLLS